jgi:hypothetical protein
VGLRRCLAGFGVANLGQPSERYVRSILYRTEAPVRVGRIY